MEAGVVEVVGGGSVVRRGVGEVGRELDAARLVVVASDVQPNDGVVQRLVKAWVHVWLEIRKRNVNGDDSDA